jgi:hypothetical protein
MKTLSLHFLAKAMLRLRLEAWLHLFVKNENAIPSLFSKGST